MCETTLAKTIRECVVNDYFTPSIKAEVILDTLLTPYVAEIVNAQSELRMELVAKEMSVLDTEQTKQNSTYGKKGTKIDYILAGETFVYLVELKTTDGSIKEKQARRYLSNCRSKTFGAVFGDKLLDILNQTFKNASPWTVETLHNTFHSVTEGYQGAAHAEQAKALLKGRKLDSTYKYLYTVGQILDYRSDGRDLEALWNKKLRLLYLAPDGDKWPSPLLENEEKFYICPQGKKSFSLVEAGKYLGKKQDDALAQLLAGIIEEIYGG